MIEIHQRGVFASEGIHVCVLEPQIFGDIEGCFSTCSNNVTWRVRWSSIGWRFDTINERCASFCLERSSLGLVDASQVKLPMDCLSYCILHLFTPHITCQNVKHDSFSKRLLVAIGKWTQKPPQQEDFEERLPIFDHRPSPKFVR